MNKKSLKAFKLKTVYFNKNKTTFKLKIKLHNIDLFHEKKKVNNNFLFCFVFFKDLTYMCMYVGEQNSFVFPFYKWNIQFNLAITKKQKEQRQMKWKYNGSYNNEYWTLAQALGVAQVHKMTALPKWIM